MQIAHESFNNATSIIEGKFGAQWGELSTTLTRMPLHLKASDQAGKQGRPIFDPVGTNQAIKDSLTKKAWKTGLPIPGKFDFLGTDIDFEKDGLLVEVQFSNYPFLLNNLLRSELFFKARLGFSGPPVEAVIIVTKAHMFEASNSTLYYEQAVKQMTALAENKVFDVPMRVVGLFEETNKKVKVQWSEYHNPRYSRTVVRREEREKVISGERSGRSRCRIDLR